ncbi:MAG: alpha-L-fucosidase [Phycisphaeraceae bacterium]|nr:alpha-L-fucosidase [Phycisphaeraceae bacterium]
MMQPWFEDARLGIFLHWGIYAVNGISESWSFYRGKISYEDYLRQFEGFTAQHYDPDAWARLFKSIHADYAVLTAKHHDGVALWDTSQSDLSIPARAPAGRDLIGPFAQAMRRAGLRTGIYFSHLDWSHPDYPTIVKPNGPNRPEDDPGYDYSYPRPGHEDPERWERFLAFHRAQLQELCRNYEPDLLWFDGDW